MFKSYPGTDDTKFFVVFFSHSKRLPW
jgi:hypothetical protein